MNKLTTILIIVIALLCIGGTVLIFGNVLEKVYLQYIVDNNITLYKNNCTYYYDNQTNHWEGINCTCYTCNEHINGTNLPIDYEGEIIYGDGERRSGWPIIEIKNISQENQTWQK